jgi:hypothetical protein
MYIALENSGEMRTEHWSLEVVGARRRLAPQVTWLQRWWQWLLSSFSEQHLAVWAFGNVSGSLTCYAFDVYCPVAFPPAVPVHGCLSSSCWRDDNLLSIYVSIYVSIYISFYLSSIIIYQSSVCHLLSVYILYYIYHLFIYHIYLIYYLPINYLSVIYLSDLLSIYHLPVIYLSIIYLSFSLDDCPSDWSFDLYFPDG